MWLATTPGPTIPYPWTHGWSVESGPRSDESTEQFADRCATQAYTYVADFAWDSDDLVNARHEPYFNLVLEWPVV